MKLRSRFATDVAGSCGLEDKWSLNKNNFRMTGGRREGESLRGTGRAGSAERVS